MSQESEIQQLENSINNRFDDSDKSINCRFDDSDKSINRRFDDFDKRLDNSYRELSNNIDSVKDLLEKHLNSCDTTKSAFNKRVSRIELWQRSVIGTIAIISFSAGMFANKVLDYFR